MVKNRTLIVTGMHCSGTSAVTQWLNKCGLHVGDTLTGSVKDDDQYEDVDFIVAHQAILKAHRFADSGYNGPLRQLKEEETDRLKDIVAFKNSFNQQWGWKDPRTVLFLDTYRVLIPGAFYFFVLRDYQSVISSLINRLHTQSVNRHEKSNGLGAFMWAHFREKRNITSLLKKHAQEYLQVWISYHENMLQHLQQVSPQNYVVADAAVLYHHDKPVFEHITKAWGFVLDFFAFRNIQKDHTVISTPDINPYIKNKLLISKAADLEYALKRLCVFNTTRRAVLQVV